MKHMQLRDAKARLSEVVASAEKGEPVTITRHGTPVAVVVPVDAAERAYPRNKTFGQHLLEFPGGIEFERDPTPPRDIDL